MSPIGFLRLHASARIPTRAHPDDAGFDLHAVEAVELLPGARAAIRCGFAIALPPGSAGLVLPRSGLALRMGVTVLNAPGLIDAGYRGEVKVVLINHDPVEACAIASGDRIAQLVIVTLPHAEFVEQAVLSDTSRGVDGFGSTDRLP